MAAFASSGFSTRSFSTSAFFFDGSAPAAVQYGGWFSHPFIRDRKRRTHDDVRREREKLGIIAPPEVEKATEKAVTAVLEARTVPDVSTDLQAAEMELRAALSQLGQEMRQEYLTLLALEYARQEIEIEEAQIVMLLFDM